MGVVVYIVFFAVFPEGRWGTAGEVLLLFGSIFIGIAAYIGVSLVLKNSELDSVLAIVRGGRDLGH